MKDKDVGKIWRDHTYCAKAMQGKNLDDCFCDQVRLIRKLVQERAQRELLNVPSIALFKIRQAKAEALALRAFGINLKQWKELK